MNDNQDPLWVYVGQISGVITIFGAVVVVIAVIFVVSLRSAFKWHITSAEVTWISFLAGVFASGIVSLVYGIQLFRRKLSVFRDQGKLSVIAFWFGFAITVVAIVGFVVPAVIGTYP